MVNSGRAYTPRGVGQQLTKVSLFPPSRGSLQIPITASLGILVVPVVICFYIIPIKLWNELELYIYQIKFNNILYLKLRIYPQFIRNLKLCLSSSLNTKY